MATIASLAVQLIADPSRFSGGLKVAEKAAQRFGKSALNPGLWAKMASSGLGKIQGAIDGVLGPIKNLVGSIPLIGGSLAAFPTSVGGFAEWFKEGSSRINEMRVTAQKLGIGIEKVAGLMLAAGPASESMAISMLRLQKELGEAAMKAEGTEVTFARLGLNARELSESPLEVTIGKIADKINLLDNQAAKGAAVFSIFGKRGAELMPLLARGSAGIEMFQKKAQEMGLAVSSVDAENVRQATIAIKSLDRWIKAAKQSVAVELSPVVMALADQFAEVGVNAKAVGQWAKTGIKVIAYGGALAVEAWKGLTLVWDVLKAGFKGMIAAIASGLAWLLEQAGKLPDKMGGETFRDAAASVRSGANEMWEGLSEDRKAFWDKWGNDKSAFRSVDQFFEAVERKTEETRRRMGKGPTENTADFTRLFQMFERGQKVMQEMSSPAEKFADRMKELNELVDAGAIKWETWSRASGKAIMEAHKPDEFMLGTETALEKFADRVAELNQLLAVGAIKGEAYERALYGAGKSLIDLHKTEQNRMSGAAAFGSQEAYSIINRNILNAGGNKSFFEKFQAAAKAELEIEKQQLKEMREFNRKAGQGFIAVGRIGG